IRSMEEFENLAGFLEHIALVMDTERGESDDKVSIMTLHSAKGLEFDTVFLPGWEEGLFPHQRALDEQGRAGLEEERRLAHVGPIYDDDDVAPNRATTSPPPHSPSKTGVNALSQREGQGGGRYGSRAPKRRMPLTIEGELVAKSTGTTSAFGVGDRVFHQK